MLLPPELAPLLSLLSVVGAFVLPVVAGALVAAGARSLGLDAVPLPGLTGFRWSTAAGFLAFGWGVCVALATFVGGDLVADAAALLARLGGAGACLFVGAWVGRARAALVEERGDRFGRDAPRAGGRDDAAWRDGSLAVSALAALASLAGAGVATLIVAAALVVAAAFALQAGQPAATLRDLLRDLAAGIELRERITPGAALTLEGIQVSVGARPGLLATRLSDGVEVRNGVLLAALGEKPRQPEPATLDRLG